MTATNMASWNGLKFKVSSNEATAIKDLQIKDSYSDEYNEKGKKVGRELSTFSLSVTYFSEIAGKWKTARKAMQTWRRATGKAAYLYLAGNKLTNRKVRLVGVSSGGLVLDNRGRIIAVEMQLEFQWVRTKAQEKAAKKAATQTATKSKTTKKTSTTKTKNGVVAKKPKSSSVGKYTGGRMSWPVPGHTRISSDYGPRYCPFHGREIHSGIDIPAPSGTRIVAAASGTVVLAGYNGSYGNCVIISHGSGIYTLYGHQSRVLVKRGQKVKEKQQIGKVGTTGSSTGNHLHFEVRKGGNSHGNHTNPWKYVKK